MRLDPPTMAYRMVLRMAAEGIPLAAIARVTFQPYQDVRRYVHDAKTAGLLSAIPARDWPDGTRIERRPTTKPTVVGDRPALTIRLQVLFDLTPNEAKFLAALATFEFLDRPTLRQILTTKSVLAGNKIVDVYACHVRKALKAHGITFENVRGFGYRMPEESRRRILDLVAEGQEAADAA